MSVTFVIDPDQNRVLATNSLCIKVAMQEKLFQMCAHLLYCSVLSPGVNVNTRWMSKPSMESIFYIKNQLNILFIGNFYVNYQNYQNLMLLTSSDTVASIPPRDNWFQNVRRVYASAINLPCIITLLCIILNYRVI